MSPEDPNQLADELEQEAAALQRHGEEVRQRIDDTRQEWEAKRTDESVPGAPPPPENEDASGGPSEGGPGGVGEPGGESES